MNLYENMETTPIFYISYVKVYNEIVYNESV